jgi:hypothetical protein
VKFSEKSFFGKKMEGHRMARRLAIYHEKYRGLQADQPGDEANKVTILGGDFGRPPSGRKMFFGQFFCPGISDKISSKHYMHTKIYMKIN